MTEQEYRELIADVAAGRITLNEASKRIQRAKEEWKRNRAEPDVSQEETSNASNSIVRLLQHVWSNPTKQNEWELDCITKSVRELSENSSFLIGKNGVKRFKKFTKLKRCWDGDEGKVLDSQSVASFECFVGCCRDIIPEEPSIFLSSRGYLQLGWEDAGGNKIEVEFFPRMIQYFNEADGREIEVPIEKLNYAKKYIFSDGTDRV